MFIRWEYKIYNTKQYELLECSVFGSPLYSNMNFYRPLVEEVRNCTKVAKDVQNEILQIIVNKLLEVETPLVVPGDGIVAREWNAGGTLPISQISQSVPGRLLLKIKNECGGLQVSTVRI